MLPARPKIAILGAGALGCYIGSLLARAGQDVHFLARSDYPVLRERGLEVLQPDGSRLALPRVQAHADPAALGPSDLVLVALKTTAAGALPELLPPLLGPETVVLTLQNGMGNIERLARWVPLERLLGGLCLIGVVREEPGRLRHFSLETGTVLLAEAAGAPVARTEQVAGLLRGGGLEVRLCPSLEEALWRKLIWNVPFNGLTIAAGGVPTDQIVGHPALRELSWALMRELQAAARARGCEISDGYLERQIPYTESMGPYLPSSLIDFQAGREVEIEAIFGEPLRRGRAAGVPMPHLFTLHTLLDRLCGPSSGRGARPAEGTSRG